MVLFSLVVHAGHQVTIEALFPSWKQRAARTIRWAMVACLMLATSSRCAVLAADADEAPSETAVAADSQGRMLGFTRLREGTLVPATVGTIVLMGPRRWAFLPAEKPKPVKTPESLESESLKITVTQQDGTTTRRVDSLTLSVNATQNRFVGGQPGQAPDATNDQKAKSDASQLVLITENLMLQRIVEAIREDEFDKSWEVTGKVTEYFGENRLTILTAQRAESKDLLPSEKR